MKKIYISLLFIFLLCLPFSKVKAQWVAISDTNFVNWLGANGNFYGLQCAAGISGVVKIIMNGM